jgi:hypothetical protein
MGVTSLSARASINLSKAALWASSRNSWSSNAAFKSDGISSTRGSQIFAGPVANAYVTIMHSASLVYRSVPAEMSVRLLVSVSRNINFTSCAPDTTLALVTARACDICWPRDYMADRASRGKCRSNAHGQDTLLLYCSHELRTWLGTALSERGVCCAPSSARSVDERQRSFGKPFCNSRDRRRPAWLSTSYTSPVALLSEPLRHPVLPIFVRRRRGQAEASHASNHARHPTISAEPGLGARQLTDQWLHSRRQ